MSKIYELTPVFVDNIPNKANLEAGKLYISEEYKTATHLCACGCGELCVTPLGKGGWDCSKNGDLVTLSPSIGNWSGQNPYHAHYFIQNNKIIWA